jgi:5-formyltetrahydrofolate cyclo-ligase
MSENSTPETGCSAVLLRRRLRIQAIEQRLALKNETIAAWSQRIISSLTRCFPVAPGRVAGFCWPVKNEPDLLPVLSRWREDGTRLALPVVVKPDAALRFRAWQPGTTMVTDGYGIPTPAEGDFVVPDVLLIPLNAFDSEGYRLGYGGGYFDRTLAEIQPRPLAIGVGFEIGRAPTVWPQPHDVRLDWIVTEAGATRI